MQSETGAIADEGWIYHLAFREHGVLHATDIDDLLDRAAVRPASVGQASPHSQHRRDRGVGWRRGLGGRPRRCDRRPGSTTRRHRRLGPRPRSRRHREPARPHRLRVLARRPDAGGVREVRERRRPTGARMVGRRRRRRLEQQDARTARARRGRRRHTCSRQPGRGDIDRRMGDLMARPRRAVRSRHRIGVPRRRRARPVRRRPARQGRLARRRSGRRARARRGAGADRERRRPDGALRGCDGAARQRRHSRRTMGGGRSGRPGRRGGARWRRASVHEWWSSWRTSRTAPSSTPSGSTSLSRTSSTRSPSCARSPAVTRSMPPWRSRRWSAGTPRRSPACTAGPGWATCSCSAAVVCSSS